MPIKIVEGNKYSVPYLYNIFGKLMDWVKQYSASG